MDVYYYEDYAKSCCIVFEICENEERIVSEYCAIVQDIDEYVPGEFYKREMPCLLKVLKQVKECIDLIIVDSFVWIGKDKKGMGAHLYEALNEEKPVIGVAKTHFSQCTNYVEVYRGISTKPLFVSAVGLEIDYAAALIKNLKGANRIPDTLKKVDRLSRATK